MKLTSLSLRNIKCFENLSIDLLDKETGKPLSVCVLIGANGSGKTTVLKSIVSTFSIANSSYMGDIFEKNAIRTGEKISSVDIKFLLNDYERSILEEKNSYDTIASEYDIVEVDPDTFEEVVDLDEIDKENINPLYGLGYFMTEDFEEEFQFGLAVPFDSDINQTHPDFDDFSRDYANFIRRINSLNSTLVVYFDSFRYLTEKNPISPNFSETIKNPKVAALSSSISKDGTLSPRFFDLKQWFFNLDFALLKKPNSHTKKIYNHFIKACNKLFSPLQFEDISEHGEILFKDVETGMSYNLNMLSDGFKSVFIMIAELLHRLSLAYNPTKNSDIEFYELEAIILIDEVDCHLHPRWQVNLMPALQTLFPNCQFIITTHSPYILKKLNEKSVRKIGEDPFVK